MRPRGTGRRAGQARFDTNPNTATRAFGAIQRGLPAPELTTGRRRALAANLKGWGVDVIVVGPMEHQDTMLRFLTDLLGRRPVPGRRGLPVARRHLN